MIAKHATPILYALKAVADRFFQADLTEKQVSYKHLDPQTPFLTTSNTAHKTL